jgi:hypothetical protein
MPKDMTQKANGLLRAQWNLYPSVQSQSDAFSIFHKYRASLAVALKNSRYFFLAQNATVAP